MPQLQNSSVSDIKQLSLAGTKVLETLIYADIFKYPLTSHEVFLYLTHSAFSETEVENCLDELVNSGLIYRQGFMYGLHSGDTNFTIRVKKNSLAVKKMKLAKKISRFIGGFPFVEAVFLSGSISKDCMDADGDIDYFIVTRPGRLWLSRSLLILFKKIMLFNSYKYFCLNYFIDSEHLAIKQRNLFTATEIVTLKPTYGPQLYVSFMESNKWVKEYRPNFPLRDLPPEVKKRKWSLKKGLELLLSGKIGDSLEGLFHRLTERHWQKKYKDLLQEDYHQSIQTTTYSSQVNPENFHKKVMEQLRAKKVVLEQLHGIKID